LLAAAAVLACDGTLAGAEPWSWHSVDFTAQKTTRWEWALHTRLRTRKGELQQGRSGSIVRFRPHSQIALLGGYYFGKEEDTREEWQESHRGFGGVEAGVYSKGAVSVAARGLVERFAAAGRPGFTRLRGRLRLTTGGRIGPYASTEWFFDRKGYLAGRYSGGLRWRWSSWSSLEAGYMYDARNPALGVPRHGIVTHLFLERPRKERRTTSSIAPSSPNAD